MESKYISKELKKCQDHAIELRNRGYGCAQCVLMALSSYIGLPEKQAARIAAAYNSGFSSSGNMCGAISILGVAEGLLSEGYGPEDKSKIMWNTKDLLDKFTKDNQDRYLCPDLKGKEDARKCPDLIKQAIELFFESHPEIAQEKVGFFSGIKKIFS